MHMAFESQANTPNKQCQIMSMKWIAQKEKYTPRDMLDTPKPILGINDEVKSINADISCLVTLTFDLIEKII